MGKEGFEQLSYLLSNVELHLPKRRTVKEEDYYFRHQREEYQGECSERKYNERQNPPERCNLSS